MAQHICNSHTANLLAKDILDKKIVDKVSLVLKTFKYPDFEKQIIIKGHRLNLPVETRWCPYRDTIELPDKFASKLEQRKEMALNIYSLAAYFLHPTYDIPKLSAKHKRQINMFFLKVLNSQGIEELDHFNTNTSRYYFEIHKIFVDNIVTIFPWVHTKSI